MVPNHAIADNSGCSKLYSFQMNRAISLKKGNRSLRIFNMVDSLRSFALFVADNRFYCQVCFVAGMLFVRIIDVVMRAVFPPRRR